MPTLIAVIATGYVVWLQLSSFQQMLQRALKECDLSMLLNSIFICYRFQMFSFLADDSIAFQCCIRAR